MAKSRRSRTAQSTRARGAIPTDHASRRLPRVLSSIQVQSVDVLRRLEQVDSFPKVEDLVSRRVARALPRAFHAVRLGPHHLSPGGRAGRRPGRPPSLPRSLAFRSPQKVVRCVRRKFRREVLFAFKKAGYSGSAPKRHYRRTYFSNYSCR